QTERQHHCSKPDANATVLDQLTCNSSEDPPCPGGEDHLDRDSRVVRRKDLVEQRDCWQPKRTASETQVQIRLTVGVVRSREPEHHELLEEEIPQEQSALGLR